MSSYPQPTDALPIQQKERGMQPPPPYESDTIIVLLLWEIKDVFFCFGDNNFWEGESQVPPQERRTIGSSLRGSAAQKGLLYIGRD